MVEGARAVSSFVIVQVPSDMHGRACESGALFCHRTTLRICMVEGARALRPRTNAFISMVERAEAP
eukprot:1103498-Prorocentrum_lima.AAC.1